MISLFFYAVLAFLIASAVMPVCIWVARRFDLYDSPDGLRKTHHGNIPFTGGFSFIFATLAVLGVMAAMGTLAAFSAVPGGMDGMMLYFAEAGVVILLLGLFDDFRNLSYTTKFLYQFVAALFIILGGVKANIFPSVFNIETSDVFINSIGAAITMLWIVGMTNAINMIDGMDGLAGGTTLVSTAALGVVGLFWGDNLLAVFSFVLCGAVLGFVIYNFHPARVFMGDTGSMFLGFFLAVVSWLLVDSGPLKSTAVVVPVIILGLPVSDTLLAFFRRIVKGKNPFSADLFHIHHMLKLRFNLSFQRTVLTLYAVSLFYGLAGLAVAILPETTGWFVIAGVGLSKLVFLHVLGYTGLILQPREKKTPIIALAKTNGHATVNGNGALYPKPASAKAKQ